MFDSWFLSYVKIVLFYKNNIARFIMLYRIPKKLSYTFYESCLSVIFTNENARRKMRLLYC